MPVPGRRDELLDQAIEDRFFRALFEYKELARIAIPQLVAENFSSKYKAVLFEGLRVYWECYAELPTMDLLAITLRELYGVEVGALGYRVAENIMRLPVPELSWVLRKIDEWIKTIQLRKCLFETSDLLDRKDLDRAQDNLIKAIRNFGLSQSRMRDDLKLSKEDIIKISSVEDLFVCPTRIYALDKVLRGFFKKEVFVLLAPLNVGKSWFMVHCAVSALLSGCGVLYFTLEMGKERVLERLLMNVSAAVKPRGADEIVRAVRVWKNAAVSSVDKVELETHTLFDTEAVLKAVAVLSRFGGKLSVKEYASGEATVSDFYRDIYSFLIAHDRPPDVIFVDGLLDMKLSVALDEGRQRLSLIRTLRDLRKLSADENCAVVLTHQSNRQGIKAKTVDVQHTGEALGIMQVADTAVSLTQSKDLHNNEQMDLYVIRSRNTEKWAKVRIYQKFEIGQFCLASEEVKNDGGEVRRGNLDG